MPKKTLKRIIDQNNDYLVQVKGNQKALFKQLKLYSESMEALDICQESKKQRGRLELRELYLFQAPDDLKILWPGLQRFMQVKRTRLVKAKTQQETSYYISSLQAKQASFFAQGIRGHWSIENQLHYPKDVFQHEDGSRIKDKKAAANLSLFKNMAINLFRASGFESVKKAEIFFANKITLILNAIKKDFVLEKQANTG